MPLRAWYPLNGNANNMGASNLTLTQTTAPTWSTGKTSSQAMTTGAFKWTAAQSNSIFNNNEFSYACWFYVDAASGTSASDYKKIFGAEGGTNSMNRKFTCGQYPKVNDLHISSWNGSSLISCGIIEGVLPSYAWTHICYSYKKGAISIYINGVLKKTTELTMANSSYSAETPVLWNYSGRRICDVRIYDHALSQKEVAELAKGMMIHYTLDNPYTTGLYNFYSGSNARGDSSSSSFTKAKLADEDGYNFKLTHTSTGGNYWSNIRYPNISRTNFVAGRKYTWSGKLRCNTWSSTTKSLVLRNSINGNDYSHGGVAVCSSALADGQWHQYSCTLTLAEGMQIGSTYYYLTESAYNASTQTAKGYMAPLVEFYSDSLNESGTTYTMDFDIKEVQLIESDSFPGWVDNTMASNTVRDNTGGGNDATCNGTITTAAGSPRNSRAYQFVSGSSLWPIPDPISSSTQEFTISTWFRTTTTSGNQCIWNGRTTVGQSVAVFLIGATIRVDDSIQTSSVSVSTNTWYHLVITWKSGGNKIIYLNGVQKTSVTAGTLSKSNTTASIGRSSANGALSDNYFSGQMSDFRIYATALTADQVKELYNAPISVANTGACLSEQFTEGATGISFAKTGVVSCNGISSLPGKYDPDVLIEPDGSCWAHIGHHADPTTYKFASSDPFATGVWKDDRRFLDPSFCDNVDKWEFLVIQKADSSTSDKKYRWVQPVNPNTAVYEDVPSSAVTKNTGTGYTTFSTGGIYKFNSNTYYVTNNGSKGNWWGAIGAWGSHQGGIPGWAGTVVKDGGYLDLYIRIDNVTFTNGRTGCSLDKAGKAVLSPEFIEQ